ncbi:DUF3558 family protein [Nocardioides nanhaiensis]
MLPRTTALLAAAALTLSGCGTDADDGAATDPSPAPSSEAPTSEAPTSEAPTSSPAPAAGTCGGVGAPDLEQITGRSQELGRSEEDADGFTCRSTYDPTGLIVEWQRRPLIGSFQVEGENAQLNGLERERTELAGTPAWLLDGVVSGNRLASVVAVVGESTLVVETGDDGASDATVTDRELVQVARDLAVVLIEEEKA